MHEDEDRLAIVSSEIAKISGGGSGLANEQADGLHYSSAELKNVHRPEGKGSVVSDGHIVTLG